VGEGTKGEDKGDMRASNSLSKRSPKPLAHALLLLLLLLLLRGS